MMHRRRYRRRFFGPQAGDIGAAIVLILFMWFCISGLPKVFDRYPLHPHLCIGAQCQ
jgi:hypothetical protein